MTGTPRFHDKLYLVLLERTDAQSIRSGRSLWALQRPLAYEAGPARDLITVPAGFVTDLASIPRLVWTFYPPDGPWVKAAIVHDFLYYTRGDGLWGKVRGLARTKPYSRAESDSIFAEAMQDRGVRPWGRFVLWIAVRLGGWLGWKVKHKHARPHPEPAALALPPVPRRHGPAHKAPGA
jgi:hypothetical protein